MFTHTAMNVMSLKATTHLSIFCFLKMWHFCESQRGKLFCNCSKYCKFTWW